MYNNVGYFRKNLQNSIVSPPEWAFCKVNNSIHDFHPFYTMLAFLQFSTSSTFIINHLLQFPRTNNFSICNVLTSFFDFFFSYSSLLPFLSTFYEVQLFPFSTFFNFSFSMIFHFCPFPKRYTIFHFSRHSIVSIYSNFQFLSISQHQQFLHFL